MDLITDTAMQVGWFKKEVISEMNLEYFTVWKLL